MNHVSRIALLLFLAGTPALPVAAQAPPVPPSGTDRDGGPAAALEDTVRLGLRDAVARAVTVDEDVLMARAEQARAAGIVKEVRSGSLPRVSASFGYTRNIQTPVIFFNQGGQTRQVQIGNDNEYAFGLNVEQTLFDFSLGPARTAARLSRTATASRVEAARTRAALAARTAYYDALLSRSLVEVQRQALAQAERRLEQVSSFHRAGTASEFDLLTARVEVANLRPALIEARNQLDLDRNRLKRRVGLPLDRPVTLRDSFPDPAPPGSRQAHLERALRERADLRAQQIRVGLQEENLRAEERDALPTLDLVAGLTRRASSAELLPPERDFIQTATAGLSFSLPLFDGNSRAGRVQQAAAARDRERYRLAQLRQDVRLEVQQAHQAMVAAGELVEASRSNVARAERALEIAQTRFQNGLSTQLELDDAELAVTEARTNLARALHAHAVARASLLAATGER